MGTVLCISGFMYLANHRHSLKRKVAPLLSEHCQSTLNRLKGDVRQERWELQHIFMHFFRVIHEIISKNLKAKDVMIPFV